MRLLIATPLYPPDPGGPATYARLLETGLANYGVEAPILVKFGDVRSKPKLLRHLAYFWNVYKEAKRADAVLALDPVSVGLPALIAAQLRRKPFIVKVVGDYAWEQGVQRFGIQDSLDEFVKRGSVSLPVAMLRAVETFVAKRAARIIVPSEYLKGIVQAWGLPEEKIEVIYNAIELEKKGVVPEAAAAALRPKIVAIGRLVPWKGLHGVIDAVAQLPEQASLVIAGDGPDRDALMAHAQEKLGEQAIFVGALTHPDALALLADADIFVLNSTYEGLSHILIEALMLGKAIIATRAGGNTELITHGENGLLVSVGDTHALASALKSLLEDPELRDRIASNARTSSARFSLDAMLERTANLLMRL